MHNVLCFIHYRCIRTRIFSAINEYKKQLDILLPLSFYYHILLCLYLLVYIYLCSESITFCYSFSFRMTYIAYSICDNSIQKDTLLSISNRIHLLFAFLPLFWIIYENLRNLSNLPNQITNVGRHATSMLISGVIIQRPWLPRAKEWHGGEGGEGSLLRLESKYHRWVGQIVGFMWFGFIGDEASVNTLESSPLSARSPQLPRKG